MQVPPCKCIDFHAERRPRTPNRPATIELALTSRNSFFRTGPAEPRATRLSEAAPPQSRTHFSRVPAPTHHYLTQTRAPTSATRLDTVAQASTGCSSTRPRPRRQASTTSVPKTRAARTTDHSRSARNVTAAPAAVVSQQRPTAPRRRACERPNASPAFTATTGRSRGCSSTASRVTRAHRARGAQQCQPCSSVLQLRHRATARATLNCTAHRCGPCRVRWSSFSLN